ncbi:MAG: hypothetical protein AB7Q29_09920 [Vicinamibacterales bacterium]
MLGLVFGLVLVTGSQGLLAQVYRHQPAPPSVTAERSAWQLAGDPLFYAGAFYDPSGPTVFFDGGVMVRTGSYEGVPLFQDVTLEPYSIVYVPVSGALMRPYERRREGPLAGTVGSRVPSRPIPLDVDSAPATSPLIVGTSGTGGAAEQDEWVTVRRETLERLLETAGQAIGPAADAAEPRAAESIPAPRSNEGLWIEYAGGRWFAGGAAVAYEAAAFERVGTYHATPVYRERRPPGSRNTREIDGRIFVALTTGGPLTPFTRR